MSIIFVTIVTVFKAFFPISAQKYADFSIWLSDTTSWIILVFVEVFSFANASYSIFSENNIYDVT